MSDDIEVLTFRRTPDGWTPERAAAEQGLSLWDVEQQAWEERDFLDQDDQFRRRQDV